MSHLFADEKNPTKILSYTDSTEIKNKLMALEERLETLEAELEVFRGEMRLVINRTQVSYLNQTYLRGGFSLILPRARTFSFSTDTGLGLLLGLGRYFGRSNAFEVTLDWDFYPSITPRYKLEYHSDSNQFTGGLVVGYKQKLLNMRPFDNFVAEPANVDQSFWVFGTLIGFAVGRSLISLEMLYLTRNQTALVANASIHYFL